MAKFVPVFICTLIIYLSVLTPLTACAATVQPKGPGSDLGGLSVTPTIGYLFSDVHTFDSSLLYGAKISYDKLGKSVTEDFGAEGTINFFTSKSKVDSSSTNGYLLRVDSLYHFLFSNKAIPFIAVGLGGISTSSASHTKVSALFNYGAGFKYFFENYLALRVDGRHLLMVSNGGNQGNFEVSVGLSYFFDKERKKKPVTKPVIKPKDNPIPTIEEKPVEKPPLPVAPKPALPEVSARVITLEGKAQVESLAPETNGSATQGKSVVVLTPGTMVVVQSGQPLPSSPGSATPEDLERARQAAIIEGQPKPVKVVKIDFDENRLNVKLKYDKQLKEIVEILKSSPGSSVKVEGFTDVKGKFANDKKFALERANSVQARLEKLGADPGRIASIGYGYPLPSAEASSTADRKKKRLPVVTVTVFVYSADEIQLTSPSQPDTGQKGASEGAPAATPTTLPPPPAVVEGASRPVPTSGTAADGTSAVPAAGVPSGQIVGKVLEISGKATIERGRLRSAVRKNSAIQAGDIITTGAKARVRLLFNDNKAYTLSGKSRLVVRDFIARKSNK